jgi:hypothetical protein
MPVGEDSSHFIWAADLDKIIDAVKGRPQKSASIY